MENGDSHLFYNDEKYKQYKKGGCPHFPTNVPPIISQKSSSLNSDFSDSVSALPSFDVSENGILKITITDDWTQTNVWTSTVFVQSIKN